MKTETLEMNRFAAWMNEKGHSAIRRRGPKLESIKADDPLREKVPHRVVNMVWAAVVDKAGGEFLCECQVSISRAQKQAASVAAHMPCTKIYLQPLMPNTAQIDFGCSKHERTTGHELSEIPGTPCSFSFLAPPLQQTEITRFARELA